ncbi:hypothetical protein EH183_20665 [Streptomyces sp. CB01881]|nr:hypothetical protein C2142_20700 [Streptomyces sp. CB01881]TYC74344.1 hypothetical protein EH183_20665 [Streptomyces sp. CB01881]
MGFARPWSLDPSCLPRPLGATNAGVITRAHTTDSPIPGTPTTAAHSRKPRRDRTPMPETPLELARVARALGTTERILLRLIADQDGGVADPTLVALTVEEAARRLGVGLTTMYALVASGEVSSVTIGRLHDARHTASTVLLLLGVPERIVMAIMGWSSASMTKRYQHVTDPMLHDVGQKIGGLLWGDCQARPRG